MGDFDFDSRRSLARRSRLFSGVFRGYKMGTLTRNELISITVLVLGFIENLKTKSNKDILKADFVWLSLFLKILSSMCIAIAC